jgi:membrane-bound ClpP family serine protease
MGDCKMKRLLSGTYMILCIIALTAEFPKGFDLLIVLGYYCLVLINLYISVRCVNKSFKL